MDLHTFEWISLILQGVIILLLLLPYGRRA
jgi:hypothetical protein